VKRFAKFAGFCVAAVLVAMFSAYSQKQATQSPKQSRQIMSAKTAYFEDRTGVDKVGEAALIELKKWGRFQVVTDKKKADLIFLLSADPYQGGHVTLASGNTGTIDNGHVEEDRVPDYNVQGPVRDAYLSVIDRATGNSLWSDSHRWGGLLTGKNSAGERLVKKFESEMKH
jgi:hypothetical protein